MKKKVVVSIFSMLSMSIGMAQHTSDTPNFRIKEVLLAPGNVVSFQYFIPEEKAAQDAKGNHLKMFVFDTAYRWKSYDIQSQNVGNNQLAGNFRVPLDAGAIFFAYADSVGNILDNNEDKGYFAWVNGDNGGRIAGAEAGYGLGRSPKYGWGIPDYFKHFNISDTATYMWLNNEILRHHESAATLVLPYAKAIDAYKKEASKNELKRAVVFLAKAPFDDERLVKAKIIADTYLKDSVLSDSIKTLESTQFPHGYLAKLADYTVLKKMYQMNQVDSAYTIFLEKYPIASSNIYLDEVLGIDYVGIYRKLGMVNVAKQNFGKVVGLLRDEPFRNIPKLFYKMVEIPYADWKTMPADTAYLFAKPIMDRWNYFLQNKPVSYWYLTDSEWKVYVEEMGKRNNVIYADILSKNNHWAEAKTYAALAHKYLHYSNAELNELQATIFAHFKETKNLDTLLSNSVKYNQATTEIIGMMKDKYIAKHGSEKGFDAYFESLKDAKTLELIKEEVAKSAVNIPAYNFEMKDQYGKSITLESLKGKTVVLDFWATWCAPCKASFPGMNFAKEYFKNDKDVVFFFVDTQERIPDYMAKTVAYTKSKGFDFNILYDKSGDVYTKYAQAIHTSGIPFKIIIDKNGHICNSNVGYKGSPTGLRDEMIDMVKLAQEGGRK